MAGSCGLMAHGGVLRCRQYIARTYCAPAPRPADDLVRILSQCLTPLDKVLTGMSLLGTTLFACAVVLRWKVRRAEGEAEGEAGRAARALALRAGCS